jgi:hypothetical protein
MAKQKYYYAIVDKDNGAFAMQYASIDLLPVKLPIFVSLSIAKKWLNTEYDKRKYQIQKIKIADLESLILKSKKA